MVRRVCEPLQFVPYCVGDEKFKNELKGFAKSKGPSNSPPTSHYRLPLLRKW